MPLTNRVDPFGQIVADPARGMFMGNRGRLHDDQQHLVRQFCSYKAWVSCLTEFNGRKRQLMAPGQYTELFFLDEATALAAGHRPCGTCRRKQYRQFKSAWLEANGNTTSVSDPTIKVIDDLLHRERRIVVGQQDEQFMELSHVPDGAMVKLHADAEHAYLKWSGRLLRWSFAGYLDDQGLELDQQVEVLTPRSIVNAIRAGYRPVVHPTAMAAS